jgi:uncharacterized protein (TIGR03086 family)
MIVIPERKDEIMELLDTLERADAGFARVLAAVPADGWAAPTVCDEWTVSDLACHLIGGCRMTVALLGGADAGEAVALVKGTSLGTDPVADFAAASAEQLTALRGAGSLEATVRHPMGEIPARQMAGFRICDVVLHTWDLARSIGADDRLDDLLVEAVWERMSPLAPAIGQMGVFGAGPSGTVREDAPLQERLLDLTGRRP